MREWNSTVQRFYSEYSREMRKNNIMVLRSMTIVMIEGGYLDLLEQKYCPTNPATMSNVLIN